MTPSVLIVGLGQIGMGYDLRLDPATHALTHARGFHRHEAFRLVGGVDLEPQRRQMFETHYACPAYADVRSAMTALQPDVVVVATPTATHCSTMRDVMQAGSPRAVLCEKPLAFQLDEAREIVDLCNARGCLLYVNYMRRADVGTTEIKHRLDAGSIGRPEKAVAWYSKGLFNNGSHLLDLLRYWLGEVKGWRVIAAGRLWDGHDPEPDVALSFGAATAYFLAAREENFSHYTVELVAANGRLRYDQGGERILWQPTIADPACVGYTILDTEAQIIRTDLARAQRQVADQLARAMQGGVASLCDGAEAFRTLETLVAIRSEL